MKIEIISIGDELLIGQTINTNASWMGKELAKIGIKNNRTTTISDTHNEIWEALSIAESRSDLILITGGLGPTKDDITKKVLCEYFDTTLILHQEVLTDIQAYFEARNKPFLEVNHLQAMLPEKASVLRNHVGTASGMWFERNGKVFVSMPGVPYEMKHLMETGVLPKVKEKFQLNELAHRTVLTHGIGESYLAEIITDWENRLRDSGLDMAYLPSPGLVKLRVTSTQGIAGPTGGTEDKPVGTVWISARSKEKIISKRFNFGNNRERNITQSALAGFNMLRKLILEEL
nr:uncharacterized protein LOC113826440 [Penaeus vannamei]